MMDGVSVCGIIYGSFVFQPNIGFHFAGTLIRPVRWRRYAETPLRKSSSPRRCFDSPIAAEVRTAFARLQWETQFDDGEIVIQRAVAVQPVNITG